MEGITMTAKVMIAVTIVLAIFVFFAAAQAVSA